MYRLIYYEIEKIGEQKNLKLNWKLGVENTVNIS